MITKKSIRKIKGGDYSELMRAIGDLVDIYNDNQYNNGYSACLNDMIVYARRLAERFSEEATERNIKSDKKGYYLLNEDEVKDITEKFFEELIAANSNN